MHTADSILVSTALVSIKPGPTSTGPPGGHHGKEGRTQAS